LTNLRALTEVVPRVVVGGNALLALAIGLVVAVTVPAYFRPMYSNSLGFVLLGVGLATVLMAFALTEVAIRIMRRGGGRRLGVGLTLCATAVLVEFVSVWIVLIGPALVTFVSTG
jgi:uncharacterized membrane protein YidH (DUF202 family)